MYKTYTNYKEFKNDFYWHNAKLQNFLKELYPDICWEFESCYTSDPEASKLNIFYHSLDHSKDLSVIGRKNGTSYDFEVFQILEK